MTPTTGTLTPTHWFRYDSSPPDTSAPGPDESCAPNASVRCAIGPGTSLVQIAADVDQRVRSHRPEYGDLCYRPDACGSPPTLEASAHLDTRPDCCSPGMQQRPHGRLWLLSLVQSATVRLHSCSAASIREPCRSLNTELAWALLGPTAPTSVGADAFRPDPRAAETGTIAFMESTRPAASGTTQASPTQSCGGEVTAGQKQSSSRRMAGR